MLKKEDNTDLRVFQKAGIGRQGLALQSNNIYYMGTVRIVSQRVAFD